MLLQVGQQVETELIQTQIHDVDAGIHILDIDHFVLKFLQLVTAVLQIAFFIDRQEVVITGTGDNCRFHAALDTTFQLDVIVEFHIGPIVNQLNDFVAAPDTIDASKALNDAHWIPVNVVVDKIVAVLQVLSFADAVGSN